MTWQEEAEAVIGDERASFIDFVHMIEKIHAVVWGFRCPQRSQLWQEFASRWPWLRDIERTMRDDTPQKANVRAARGVFEVAKETGLDPDRLGVLLYAEAKFNLCGDE